jgi:glucan biosynthesis protein C
MGFSSWPWHVKDAHQSWLLDLILDFLLRWRIALVFIVSGAALMFALRVRTPAAILRERSQRLLIPLIFGMLVIVPPQVYLERVQRHQFRGSFLDYLPHFADGFYPHGNLSWHHLWFIPYVLVLTVAAMPLFTWAQSPQGQHRLEAVVRATIRHHLYWLLFVPLALAQLAIHTQGNDDHTFVTDLHGWMQFTTLMLLGGALALWRPLLAAIQRERYVALAIGILAYIALIDEWNSADLDPTTLPFFNAVAYCSLSGLNVLAWVLAATAFLTHWFNRPSPILTYATEAAMPVYMLHQTLIVFAVYQLGHEPWPLPIKLVITFSFALLGSLALYELAIRRSSVLRRLFGVKPRARQIGAEVLMPGMTTGGPPPGATSRWRARFSSDRRPS